MTTAVQTKQHLFNNYGQRALTMVSGQGAYLYDETGKEYLDFTAGIAVCNLGHAHPGVAQVIAEQASTLIHISNLYAIPGQFALAEKLASLSGLADDVKVLFVNSGTEANEAALKLARRYQMQQGHGEEKSRVLSLPKAFHGRTMGSLSLTPKAAYHEGFTPLVPNCETPPDLDSVFAAVDETVAACIVEVIQGEAGVLGIDPAFLRALESRLHAVGALLIVDEVQTGVGRTGTFFAYEEVGIKPDIVTMAKGLGNGMPVGAVLAKKAVADAFTPGSHGTTFGGNPLAMAVANYVVDTVAKEQFLAHVREIGDAIEAVLHTYVKNVSGRGLMWGFDVPDAADFVARAAALGLLVTSCGACRIRIVPPLIIDQTHVDQFANALGVLTSVSS